MFEGILGAGVKSSSCITVAEIETKRLNIKVWFNAMSTNNETVYPGCCRGIVDSCNFIAADLPIIEADSRKM